MSDNNNPQPKVDPNLSDNTQKGFTAPSVKVRVDPQLGSSVQADDKGGSSAPRIRVDDSLSSTVELSD